jgi:2-C-methyl-D-erythritol 2,4-cyclodiphosphate synthase/2-C-methyl-D-erythritol 4-phosphate cytidylyltransferase/2-C-methyl-D-erythritol 2,4-cyclodiphosphate synthase
METRIGIGRDLHRLESGRRFILGGVVIPFDKGEAGHSDGDVLTHAIIDSLLGAAAFGDIGELFPPNDDKWKDARSLDLLKIAYGRLFQSGWRIVNIDCVVSCEEPRVLPYREAICECLRRVLIEVENEDEAAAPRRSPQLFIKAKTGEGIGSVGEGKAVEAIAVSLMEKFNGED